MQTNEQIDQLAYEFNDIIQDGYSKEAAKRLIKFHGKFMEVYQQVKETSDQQLKDRFHELAKRVIEEGFGAS